VPVFDKTAPGYDQWYKTKLGSFADKVETCLAFRLFTPEKGMKVLDVGCGTGLFSIRLAEVGFKLTGIDVSQEMLEIAKDKAKRKNLEIDFREMGVYKLDFVDESFDAVFSMATFEFVKSPQKAYDEMFRVLKKGGKILIGIINRDSRWGVLYMSKSVRENSVFKYADFKTIEEIKGLDRKNVKDWGECLFIPPDAFELDINMENEKKLSETERGGFFCVLFGKG